MAKRALDTYFAYQFVKRLSTPFDEMKAYELGVINDEGDIIMDTSDMDAEQRKHFTYFDRLIVNVKKMLMKVPGVSANRWQSLGAAMWLLKEELDQWDAEQLNEFAATLENTPLNEAPTVSIATGAMDNTTVAIGPGQQSQFGKCKTFGCDGDTFHNVRTHKNKRQRFDSLINDQDLLASVRDYAKTNPSDSIVLRDQATGAYTLLKLGKNQWG